MRPRHPDKDIEAFLRLCEQQGWTFIRGSKYFKGRCGCGVHTKTIHLTPNDSYLRNTKQYFRRLDCWKEEATK